MKPRAQLRIAKHAAAAVLPAGTNGTSPSALSAAALVLDRWNTTGEVPADIKDIAARAYASVGEAGLPPGQARHAGFAVAHAAFALHFWRVQNQEKIFASARDAVSHALEASLDPGRLDEFIDEAETDDSSS